MSDAQPVRDCKTCRWFEPLPDRLRYIGKSGSCAYPLPAWLNVHLSWEPGGLKMKQVKGIGFTDCPTWEVK